MTHGVGTLRRPAWRSLAVLGGVNLLRVKLMAWCKAPCGPRASHQIIRLAVFLKE